MRSLVVGLLAVGVLGALGVQGCRERTVVVREHHPVHEREVIVEERPSDVIIVDEAPPPRRVEVIPAPPSREYIWIEGYYSWDSGHHRHEWHGGHYVVPPPGHREWVHDEWVHDHGKYRYEPGHWK